MGNVFHDIVYARPEDRPPYDSEAHYEHQLARYLDQAEAADDAVMEALENANPDPQGHDQ